MRQIAITLCLLISMSTYAQFKKYTINDVGYISIPATMELADKEFTDDVSNAAHSTMPTIKKPISVNFKQRAPISKTYAEVIINTFIKPPGSYMKMDKLVATSKELETVNAQFRSANEYPQYKGPDKLIKWYGTSIETINGCKALKTAYLRQLGTNPYVYVESYSFFNNDRLHTLTLSYRQKDSDIWAPLYQSIKSSFHITNIR